MVTRDPAIRPSVSEPFFASFGADLDRQLIYFGRPSLPRRLHVLLVYQSLWPLMAYRFGRALKTRPIPVLGLLLWDVFRLLETLSRLMTGIYLDIDSRIGPGFLVGHFGSIYVGPGVVIGRNSAIGQTCAVAGDGSWPDTPAPVIGERVYMGIGSKVIGPVVVGDGAALGANAVVVSDVPENATVVGNPATVINYHGSARMLRLREPAAPPAEAP